MDTPIYFDPNDDVSPEESERRQTCMSKATYETEALAQAAAVQGEYQGGTPASKISAYKCRFCGHWHLSRR